MPNIIILRGLPASGKTTWAIKWVLEGGRRARVNRDDLRFATFVKPDYSYDQEEVTTATEREAAKELLKRGYDVVIDACNIRPKYVRAWIRFALAHNANYETKTFPISVEDAVVRDQFRVTPQKVGKDVIHRMAKYLDKEGNLPSVLEVEVEKVPIEVYIPNLALPDAWIVDIDGTLALNIKGRSPYDLSRVHEDELNKAVEEVVWGLQIQGNDILIVSGREDSSREVTIKWLKDHNIDYKQLYMRETGDKRKDSIVKKEIFDDYIAESYNVLGVLDDRTQVVDMWRELGLVCFQVAPGDF